jgi:hypothetical protein
MKHNYIILTLCFAILWQNIVGQISSNGQRGVIESKVILQSTIPTIKIVKEIYRGCNRCSKYFLVKENNDSLIIYNPGSEAYGQMFDSTCKVEFNQFDGKGLPEIIISWTIADRYYPSDTTVFQPIHSFIQIWNIDKNKRIFYDVNLYSGSTSSYELKDTIDINGERITKETKYKTDNCYYSYEISFSKINRLIIQNTKTIFNGACTQPESKEGVYILKGDKFVPLEKDRKKYRPNYCLPH